MRGRRNKETSFDESIWSISGCVRRRVPHLLAWYYDFQVAVRAEISGPKLSFLSLIGESVKSG